MTTRKNDQKLTQAVQKNLKKLTGDRVSLTLLQNISEECGCCIHDVRRKVVEFKNKEK